MLAKQLVTIDFPYLSPEDDGNKALDIMENLLIPHLIFVEDGKYAGIIAMEDIYNFDLFSTKIKNFKIPLNNAFVYENQHLFSVILTMNIFKTSVLPVIDKEFNYKGTITQNGLINFAGDILCIKEAGYHLMFKKNKINFSATEISNIIEQNQAEILSLYVDQNNDNSELTIYVKIKTKDIQSVMQAFDHFDYDPKILNIENTDYDEFYRERFDNFIKYLDI